MGLDRDWAITAARRPALTATMTIIRTRARPMASMDPIGLRVAYSSAQVPGTTDTVVRSMDAGLAGEGGAVAPSTVVESAMAEESVVAGAAAAFPAAASAVETRSTAVVVDFTVVAAAFMVAVDSTEAEDMAEVIAKHV